VFFSLSEDSSDTSTKPSEAGATEGRVRIVRAEDEQAASTQFMVLHEGRISFHAIPAELLACKDDYLENFLEKALSPW
jgi:hypothetical protein